MAIPYEDPNLADGRTDESAVYDQRCAQIPREMLFATDLATRLMKSERGISMNLAHRVALPALILLASATSALAQATADLSWRFTEGQELSYRSRAQTSQKATGDNPYTAAQTHEIEHVDRVLSVDADGTASIEREYIRIVIDVKHSLLGDARYDSMAPLRGDNGEAANHPAVKPFAALAGKKVTFDITAEGEVSNVQGLDSAMRSISDPLNANSLLEGGLDAFNALTPENFERQLEQSMRILPARTVRRGESWEVVIEQPLPIVGTMRSTSEYTFVRYARERGRSVALLRSKTDMALDDSGASRTLRGLVDISLSDSSGEGELRIDTELGAIRRWEHEQKYTFNVKASVGGANSEQSVAMDQTATMELISGDR